MIKSALMTDQTTLILTQLRKTWMRNKQFRLAMRSSKYEAERIAEEGEEEEARDPQAGQEEEQQQHDSQQRPCHPSRLIQPL